MRRVAVMGSALVVVLAVMLLVGCGRDSGATSVGSGTEEYSFEDVSSVELELAIGNVTCHRGEGFSVTVERENYPEVTVEESGGTLRISDADPNFSVRGSVTCDIDITVPEGVDLADVDFELNVGNVVLEGVRATTVEIGSDTGNVSVSDVEAHELGISADVGDILLSAVTADVAELESEVGSVEVVGFAGIQDATVSLTCEVGDITFLGSSEKSPFNQAGSGPSLTATSSVGDIEVRE